MAGSLVGMDIGSGSLKLAVHRSGGTQLLSVRMPENMLEGARVVAPETMSEFIRDVRHENHITARDCALVLSSAYTYFRQIDIPTMTEDELRINLPYEFRDYVTEDPGNYFYDYAVRSTEYGEDGQPTGFSLYAAAVLKETVQTYADILRKAGFKLKVALPRTIVFMDMLRAYIRANPTETTREFCLVDIGNMHTSVDFFRGDDHVASRVIDFGCQDIDDVIAEVKNVNPYIAGTYRTSDFEGVLELPECQRVYDTLAVEILKVINFYNFSNPENTLSDLYFCGSGSAVQGLLDAIDGQTEMTAHRTAELLPEGLEGPTELCTLAYAVTMGR